VNVDATPNTMTISVTSVNDAPSGTDNAVTALEDRAVTGGAAYFGSTDPIDAASNAGANALSAVEITTIPTGGTLADNGVAVTAGQVVFGRAMCGGRVGFFSVGGC